MDTMSQSDIEQGNLNIRIGFAPVRPAEFVNFLIQHQGVPSCA
jgi:phage tail sheath protein FI